MRQVLSRTLCCPARTIDAHSRSAAIRPSAQFPIVKLTAIGCRSLPQVVLLGATADPGVLA
ncbi:hypothetical protein [Candidatus Nitrospira nitrosa]|uniref:hypothetical protein n=1 Tax=Candidatus Nitrospira nitrosa TaxID=1742972 RepID=UPI000A496944|nr:hypothetical protein [Candidatus Nitrospira nitrosa]